jgi:hypothetical protein
MRYIKTKNDKFRMWLLDDRPERDEIISKDEISNLIIDPETLNREEFYERCFADE